MSQVVQWTHHSLSLAYIFLSWLLLSADRSDFDHLVLLYSILFGLYLVITHFQQASYKYIFNVAILTQVGALFLIPNLSEDIYRFLWDGSITWSGENPFNSTPKELLQNPDFKTTYYTRELYANITDLSKGNHSCYPTINQFYFVIANTFSSSVWINSFVLKFLIAGTQFLGVIYLVKLLKEFSIEPKRAFILILNPLWVIETVGNAHFEGVMFSFFIIGLYFLIKQQWLLAAVFVAFAIHVKLIPLMLLPFMLRYLGWKISSLFYTLIILIVASLGLVYLNIGNFENFLRSITLYFKAFEFNSMIYYHYLRHGYSVYGWYPILLYGKKLSKLSTFLIISYAVYGGKFNFQTMMKRMMFGLLIYFLLSTTIHPWYILTLVGISIFTNYSFGIIWSFLIFLSYSAYGPYSEPTIRSFVNLEYMILAAAILVELIRKKPILPIMNLQDSLDLRSGTGS